VEPATPAPAPTETAAPTQGPVETAIPPPNEYYSINPLTFSDGTVIEELIIKGPPVPPPGFEILRQAVSLSGGDVTLTVPAYPWVYGCSAVSAAMIAGYYDRNGYPNMYTGPTNGGVMPLFDDSSWGTWRDNPPSPKGNFTYYNNPLVASKLGLDGRTTLGSIDDYWVQYFSEEPDPFITGDWTPHTWGDAIGDFMRTSQSAANLGDAFTRFYDNWYDPAAPLTCDTIESYGLPPYNLPPDGALGRKQFYEARGYQVSDCYNQFTDISSGSSNPGGFSYAQYKAEIDAGRPVMLNLTGHTVVGVGYNDSTDTVYIHDTWDNGTHAMTWGGSYAGMDLVAVSIVNLQPASPPTAFNKTSPANLATNQPINPTLRWGTSTTANSYDYCFDSTNDNACSASWISTGANTSVTLSSLTPGTYYWQVRAKNEIGTTYANGGSTSWWSFTILPIPSAFNKSSPANGAINQPTNPTLSWGASSNTVWYQYCINTTASCTAPSSWIYTTANTSVALSGLTPGTWYWQVRARNSTGLTYANGDSTAWFSFTILPIPGAFDKSSPVNGATSQPANPALSWGSSSNALSYEYCINTNASCTAPSAWTSTGTTTGVTLSNLSAGVTYYWQARSFNPTGTTYANGDSTAWWSFTVLPLPGNFNKISPAYGANNQPLNPTLRWETSSNADGYEYCIDTIGNSACDDFWFSTSTRTSVTFSSLAPGIYFWQVRATNATGTTYANGGSTAWWSFTILPQPGPFSKISPVSGTNNQPTNPTLRWGASSNVTWYQYCLNTTASCTAPSAWIYTYSKTSVTLSSLAPGTYYWQVRARNSTGITYANGDSTAWWSFTILPWPGAFNKSSPANGAATQPTNPTLSWEASSNVAWYQYCINTTASCTAPSSWIYTYGRTSVALSGLTPGATYYWQVRARNSTGITYANGDSTTWFSFIVASAPGAFNKSIPANGAANQPTSFTLSWGASSNVSWYQYCISTIASCIAPSPWIYTYTNTSVSISGLTPGATYYWQVRARNSKGITYADGDSTGWWSFTVHP
jgi:hypothetical protein